MVRMPIGFRLQTTVLSKFLNLNLHRTYEHWCLVQNIKLVKYVTPNFTAFSSSALNTSRYVQTTAFRPDGRAFVRSFQTVRLRS